MRTLYRLVYKNGDHGAWDDDIERIRKYAKFFHAEIESRRYSMILREFKVWGGKREEKDSLYIWAKDADDAIGIARLTDQSICISQWTGNEKSYEEAIKLVKEVTGMSLDSKEESSRKFYL